MTKPTLLSDSVIEADFIKGAIKATTTTDVEVLLSQLPIVHQDEYNFSAERPAEGWKEGYFHWIPVGQDRGNAGRIRLGGNPVNPITERTINGMEAIIELARQRELLSDPSSVAPTTPRDAIMRYFSLPPLDQLPKLDKSEASKAIRVKARALAKQVCVRLLHDKSSKEFTVAIEDNGIGQSPSMIHKTLLSLGSTTKGDKPYLIGVFGQGGSSAFQPSSYSWIVSRRAPEFQEGKENGMGWTIIKHIFPKGRRDGYYAYLACHPEGSVPHISAEAADSAKFNHGTRFVHVKYDFGKGGSAITRQLYIALNHGLYNPIMPFELYSGDTLAVVNGNSYRLSSLGSSRATMPAVLDKNFSSQTIGN